MENAESKHTKPSSPIENIKKITIKRIEQLNDTKPKSLTQPNNTKSTELQENSKKTYIMKKSQSKYMKQNNLIQIESKGTVKIINDSHEKIQIAEMLKAEPVISSIAESRPLKKGGKPRELCKKSNQPPFSAIGVLFTKFNYESEGYGTAFLIADNVVLTAAHNVYCREGKISATHINLIMEIYQKRGKAFRAVCAYVPKEYKQGELQKQIRNNDFAILILGDSEELRKRKYSKIQLSLNAELNDKIGVYGYPFQFSQEQRRQIFKLQRGETSQKPQEKYLFSSQDEIVQLEITRIFYKATTSIGDSGSPVLRLNQNSLIYEAVGIHTHGHQMQNSGVRITFEVLNRIKKWIQAFWEGKESDERMMLIDKGCYQIVPVKSIQRSINKGTISITPDTNTYAWKQKMYRQHDENKNVCINQSGYEWLCSSDLPFDSGCVFTIKAINVSKGNWYGKQCSSIMIGVMESAWKTEKRDNTRSHCVYLNLLNQNIWGYNQKLNNWDGIDCCCQTHLSLPCLIECHVNQQLSTIAWHYNGKQQAKTNIPQSWKDGRKICAVVDIWNYNNCVEFM